MYGTGSHISHCTMALWIEDELYVIESTGDGFLPNNGGIMKTKYADWIQRMEATSENVAHLPLTPDMAKKFDAEKALAFFNSRQGLPYGNHNFLYGWVDTPDGDWPPLLAKEIVPVVFSLVEKIAPASAFEIFTAGLNLRLKTTEDKTISEIAGIAADQNMTL